MIWNRRDRNPLIAVEQQQGANGFRTVVVQQVVVPMALDQFRNQHGDDAIRFFHLLLKGVVDDRFDDKAVR